MLTQLSREFKIMALQEIHGGKEDFDTLPPQIAKDFNVYCSRGPSAATGGVAFLIHKSITEDGDEVNVDEFALGRVI